MIDITPGVCGHNSHQRILEGEEEGMADIGGVTYWWHGGCPRCVDEKLREITDKIEPLKAEDGLDEDE